MSVAADAAARSGWRVAAADFPGRWLTLKVAPPSGSAGEIAGEGDHKLPEPATLRLPGAKAWAGDRRGDRAAHRAGSRLTRLIINRTQQAHEKCACGGLIRNVVYRIDLARIFGCEERISTCDLRLCA